MPASNCGQESTGSKRRSADPRNHNLVRLAVVEGRYIHGFHTSAKVVPNNPPAGQELQVRLSEWWLAHRRGCWFRS